MVSESQKSSGGVILIYNKKYIFIPISDTELLKPLEFPMIKARKFLLLCKCGDFGKPLVTLRMGAGHQQNQPCNYRVGTFRSTLLISGRREGLEVESIANVQ